MSKIKSETFLTDQQVCDFLNKIRDNGWNLSMAEIWITQGRSDMKTVFYDEKLAEPPKRNSGMF